MASCRRRAQRPRTRPGVSSSAWAISGRNRSKSSAHKTAPHGGIAKRFNSIVLGVGKKLFADGSSPHSFKLARSRVCPNGVIVGHYEREGTVRVDLRTIPATEREIARRERMKREG